MTFSFYWAVVDVSWIVLRAPQQNSNFTPVHEDEAFALMGDIWAKTAANNAVPGGQVHLIELCLNDLSNIVENTSLLEGKCHTVNGMLLHEFVHVSILNDSVLGLLLIDSAVSLSDLWISLWLVLLSLSLASVSCNLCDCLRLCLSLHIS